MARVRFEQHSKTETFISASLWGVNILRGDMAPRFRRRVADWNHQRTLVRDRRDRMADMSRIGKRA
ncbi:MAG: hypothetical protein JSR56_13000 [Proteobacteria bacterium]|nr:hypothetical protein [Pseudomonadota bacterium]